MEEKKTSFWGQLVVVIFIILVWWGITSNRNEQTEANIVGAVENICEKQSLRSNCYMLGLEVVDEYKRVKENNVDYENSDY